MATATHGQLINGIPPGGSASLEKIEHGGALEARRMPSGAVWLYWRFTAEARTERVRIGPYDPSAPPKSLKPTPKGFSVAAAMLAARELAKVNAETPGGLRAQRERDAAVSAAAEREKAARGKHTLLALCTAYADWLKKHEKPSHYDARNIFHNHIEVANPDLAAKAAAEVEKREIVAALRVLTEAGKTTTARKLRAYLRAAYATALRSDSDTTLPAEFIAFNVISNPVESVTPIKGGKDKNPLSLADLRRYWRALKAEEGVQAAALRLHLASGAQRVAQIVRLQASDLSPDTMQILDPKGKRTEPRPHLLPITPGIRAELGKLPKKGYVFSTDGGKTPMHPTSLSVWAADIAARAGIEEFQLKRVRSGVETRLAELGIPLHIRGQLQSHGLSGVQEGHYDAHTYLPEKRNALLALQRLLEQKPAKNVTPIKAKKRA